jgi:AcrR family transcriptional regulator
MATDTKSQILQTALKMFLKKNYKEVSLNDIVNEVGLTKEDSYHYYTGKKHGLQDAVKYFYYHVIITDYKNFTQTTLKNFYTAYLQNMQKDMEGVDTGDMNFFIFISKTLSKISDFKEIHHA